MPTRKAANRAAKRTPTRQSGWTGGLHALAAVGTETAEVVDKFRDTAKADGIFGRASDQRLRSLADALVGWSDGQAAKIAARYFQDLGQCEAMIDQFCAWVRAHPDNANNVFECLAVDPPERVKITRVLSRAGSQKVVYLASWNLTQKQVVLKRLVSASAEVRRQVEEREAQSHPLSMAHPNIIETYIMRNATSEVFLVEEHLPLVLSDGWRCRGVQEAANLLTDVASALHYLHTTLRLVHGDVKPDNIGRRGGDYILLDFGICRSVENFVYEPSATGSLRTRAPELLTTDRYACPTKADAWALGATVYNALLGRYPLLEEGEVPPRITEQPAREQFETELRRRVRDEWTVRVGVERFPEPIRGVLAGLLALDPEERWSCGRAVEAAHRDLAGFLRNQSEVRRVAPRDELDQLVRYLPPPRVLRLMPATEKDVLLQRLNTLCGLTGVSEDDRHRAIALCAELR